jgi:patatin-like phospholipase/acyl hydrolase
LSIDGGGLKGVFPAHVLKCIEQKLGIDVRTRFDLIAGTSTGSIIAAGLACGKTATSIVDLYLEHGKGIFPKRKGAVPRFLDHLFSSKYTNDYLKVLLSREFEGLRLGTIKQPLLLPATDVGLGGVHIFKSGYSDRFHRDRDVLVGDAVLASCSAPTYFDPHVVDSYLLADGGLWANNPALSSVIEAQKELGISIQDIRILTIGTGHSKVTYGTDSNRSWGFINGWRKQDFISFILSLQAQSTHNHLRRLLAPEQFVRIDFESDLPIPLDDPRIYGDLISRADKEFTYQTQKIKEFLKVEA